MCVWVSVCASMCERVCQTQILRETQTNKQLRRSDFIPDKNDQKLSIITYCSILLMRISVKLKTQMFAVEWIKWTILLSDIIQSRYLFLSMSKKIGIFTPFFWQLIFFAWFNNKIDKNAKKIQNYNLPSLLRRINCWLFWIACEWDTNGNVFVNYLNFKLTSLNPMIKIKMKISFQLRNSVVLLKSNLKKNPIY